MLHPIPPITDRRIRIALVGCGRISRNHIKAIAAHQERAELVAICDTQAERLEQAQQLIAEAAAEHPGAGRSRQCPLQYRHDPQSDGRQHARLHRSGRGALRAGDQ